MNSITVDDLINLVSDYDKDSIDTIRRCYEYANQLHDGQYRQSGEKYIIHPLNVAYILAQMQADVDTICAGLLHDTLEDTNITKEDIAHNFNPTVAELVDGVTKISKMNFSSKEEQNYANTRKIIISITSDVRKINIKLADRLHNMRTLEYKSEFKQKENALETMEIYVPLAYYIGAYKIKSELEDLSFKYLKPSTYAQLCDQKQKIELDNNEVLYEMTNRIERLLNDHSIPNEIKIRTKNIYGIYKKIREGYKMANIHDLLALKVMVDSIDECYRTLGLIHSEYHPINNKFKDYICNPKTNMYRSLHTTVFGPNDRIVQTQIRTFDMEKVNTYGLTALWNIEKGNIRQTMQDSLKSKYQFFESLVEISKSFTDNKEFVEQIKSELFSDRVYIYTYGGDVIELPKGSSIIDLAYKLGEDVGNTLAYAIVNDVATPPSYILQNKDRVKIITNDLAYGPGEGWNDKIVTSNAKNMLRQFKNSWEH